MPAALSPLRSRRGEACCTKATRPGASARSMKPDRSYIGRLPERVRGEGDRVEAKTGSAMRAVGAVR